MTKTYVIVSLVLLVAVLFGAVVFADAGMQLADVSWNSLPSFLTAGGAWTG